PLNQRGLQAAHYRSAPDNGRCRRPRGLPPPGSAAGPRPTSKVPGFAGYPDRPKPQGEEAAAILGIRVFLTRFGASAFEMVVSDPELKWQAKPTFTDCKEVKIELGVPGKLKKVFDGEVTAWRTELERDGPTVLVVRG